MKKNPFYPAIILCFIILFQLFDVAPAAAAPGDFLYQLGRKPLFSYPGAITCDAGGNVYVMDDTSMQVFNSSGALIRKVVGDPSGTSQFQPPYGAFVVDGSGNFYVAIMDAIMIFDKAGTLISKWTPRAGDGTIVSPNGIAVSSSGNVYVSDTAGRIVVFDRSGRLIKTIGSTGTGNGQFVYPAGLAFDAGGRLYVVDGYNCTVQVFDTAGNFIRKWGTYGTADGEFAYPMAIALDSYGNSYVMDPIQERVQVFNSTGTFVRRLGGHTEEYAGDFCAPGGVAVGIKGEVYVSDYYNRVQIFDSASGKLLRTWGSAGSADGQFNAPNDSAVDANGNVFVADGNNHRIQVFGADGRFLRKWGSFGAGDGQFNNPSALALDGVGNVYVAEALNNRIQVFNSAGTFLRKWSAPAPSSIAIDRNGEVYTLDRAAASVYVYDSAGNLLRQWGGPADEHIGEPQRIAVDAVGNVYLSVYLSDLAQFLVNVFDSSGNFLRVLGEGDFMAPSGIAVDPAGIVFVTDKTLRQVFIFDGNSFYPQQWGYLGESNGSLMLPVAVALDRPGAKVFVTDRDNNRVAVLEGFGTGLPPGWSAPTITLTTPVDRATFPAPATVAISANPTAAAVAGVKQVDFYAGTVLVGTAATPPFTVSWKDVAVGSYSLTAKVTDSYGMTATSPAVAITVSEGGLPAPWLTQDVGSVGPAGSVDYVSGAFTIKGSGADIWSTADAFRFVYQRLSGNLQIVARVNSVQNSNGYAKGGVMIREALTANSSHAMMDLTPAHGAEFSRRLAAGGTTTVTAAAGISAPYWVRLVRYGDSVTGSISQDGVNWVQQGTSTIPMTSAVYVGLVVNSHNPALCSATMDGVSITAPRDVVAPTVTAFALPATSSSLTVPITALTASDNVGVTGYLVGESAVRPSGSASGWSAAVPTTYSFTTVGTKTMYAWARDAAGNISSPRSATVTVSAGELPTPWLTQDIGGVGLTGSASYLDGSFTLKGGGADVWGAADAFRFVYKVLTGDGEIVARVASLQNTNPYAKGGVMIRQSLAADSVHAMMDLRPTGGAEFSRRTTAGGATTATTVSGPAAPYWVKLARSGNLFTGSVSSDGVTWLTVGSSPINMTASVFIGLIANSHNNSVLCTTTIDGVK